MAITSATFLSYTPVGPNRYNVRASIIEDGVTKERWFNDVRGATGAAVRDAVSTQIANENDARQTKDALVTLAAGSVIPITRPAAPALSAAEQNLADFAKVLDAALAVQQAIDNGVTGAATDIAALKTALNTAYGKLSAAQKQALRKR